MENNSEIVKIFTSNDFNVKFDEILRDKISKHDENFKTDENFISFFKKRFFLSQFYNTSLANFFEKTSYTFVIKSNIIVELFLKYDQFFDLEFDLVSLYQHELSKLISVQNFHENSYDKE
jgi:hypothetical protein